MLVVSNTSPISYLVIIEQIELLPRLFECIHIPETVRDELASLKAPPSVQKWIASPPSWLTIQSSSTQPDSDLLNLDAGECAAILLAESLKADLILLDDLVARRLAASRGLAITGILGILDRAATENWIDFALAIERLQQTNFRTSAAIVQDLLQKHAKRVFEK
jgi:predicted nucleic acid-binding protein